MGRVQLEREAHALAEARFLQGDVDALADLVRSPWPLDAAVVAQALRNASGPTLEQLAPRMGIGSHSYRHASVIAKRVADLTAETRSGLRYPAVKVALLGDVTTDYVKPVLEASLLEHGVDGTVRTGDFGQLEELVLDPRSWLAEFQPDLVLVLSSTLALAGRPNDTRQDALARRVELCHLVTERLSADTVVTTLEPLPEHTGPAGIPAWIGEYNAELRRATPERAYVFDLAALVSEVGTDEWFDVRLWSMAGQSVDLNCVPLLADRLAGFVRALYDPPVKLIVTDLDNTLWGGTVAEIGAEAIEVGGNEKGAAYLRLQQFLRECADNGFLLAACSKNTVESAHAPFEQRPEMALALDDFVDVQVSYLPKSVVLPQIAERLNLGLQNVLFLDDEQHERAEMRERNPAVMVPEWPEDGVNGLPALLARKGWTTRVRLTADDKQRAQTYRKEGERRIEQARYADLDDFLRSLDLEARFAPIGAENLDRVTQLIHKTNQFNLTTIRPTRRELEELIDRPGVYARAVRVEDRYGPYGLTGVLVAHPNETALVIDIWLMSCRIMGKTMEYAMFEHLLSHARAAGFATIEGRFRPTDKNAAIAGLLPELGFAALAADGDVQRFEFPAGADPKGKDPQVTVIDEIPEGSGR